MNRKIEEQLNSELKNVAPTIKIKNIGPIPELTIPIPAEGGVIVLRGENGSGKSKALEATQALLRGSGSLEVKDREISGAVEGFGAKITVGRSTRRTGELDCRNLEGKLDITALVDPGMKDQAANDARRIKALISLTGVTADKELFVPLLGTKEDFEAVVSKSSTETDDLVEMASKIKRDMEAEARRAEDQAEKAKGHAASSLDSIQGIDLTAEADATKLQTALVGAIQQESTLKAKAEAHAEAAKRKETALEAIQKATSDYTGPTVAVATATLEEAKDDVAAATEEHIEAEEAFRRAQITVNATKSQLEFQKQLQAKAEQALTTAQEHAKSVAELGKQIIESHTYAAITPEELAIAADAVKQAQAASDLGVTIRNALERRASAEDWTKKATQYAKYAIRLREAARSTDEVLSKAVASDVLAIEAGRLVTQTDRGTTLFSDLSQGEKWKLALKIASERAGKTGVIIAKEPAWVSIDPANRQFVHETAKSLGVVLLVEEPTDGELRAEVYEEKGQDLTSLVPGGIDQ